MASNSVGDGPGRPHVPVKSGGHNPPPPNSGGGNTLNHNQQNVYDLMQATLASWGLTGLAKDLRRLIIGGDTAPDTLALALSQTDAYKTRFAGNALRAKLGLRELSPAEYLATEEQYHATLRQYGIPNGFYDDKSATDKWIGGDVSPSELQDRVRSAAELVYNSPKEAQQAWDQFYGGGPGGAIAAILDPTKAAPLVEKQVAASQIGGAALAQGLTATAGRAETFASEGVTLQQAQQAYSDIASRLGTDQSAAARFGTTFGQHQEEAATLEGKAGALHQQNTLYAEEASLFGGHAGATVASGNQGSNY